LGAASGQQAEALPLVGFIWVKENGQGFFAPRSFGQKHSIKRWLHGSWLVPILRQNCLLGNGLRENISNLRRFTGIIAWMQKHFPNNCAN
jgi:hypothetical protein